ncbi:hypothetical protein [Rhodanobacter sp. BL-MT-08]
MPTTTTSRLPPPESWDEFEDICKSAFSLRWANPNLARHGRLGQKQDGVDIYGIDSLQNLVGVQCKNTTKAISVDVIESECLKAESFNPALSVLYIATTADRDANIQSFVRKLSESRKTQNKFPVDVVFWPDVVHDLSRDESAVRQHYPQFFNRLAKTPEQLKREADIENVTSILKVVDFNSTFGHLRWGAKYIHSSIVDQFNNIELVRSYPSFNLHNQLLIDATKSLAEEWGSLCRLISSAPYDLIQNDMLRFNMPGDFCRDKQENDLYEEIDAQIEVLVRSIRAFCSLINTNYLEINIEAAMRKARSPY